MSESVQDAGSARHSTPEGLKRDPRAKMFGKHKISVHFDSMQRQAFVKAVKVHCI